MWRPWEINVPQLNASQEENSFFSHVPSSPTTRLWAHYGCERQKEKPPLKGQFTVNRAISMEALWMAAVSVIHVTIPEIHTGQWFQPDAMFCSVKTRWKEKTCLHATCLVSFMCLEDSVLQFVLKTPCFSSNYLLEQWPLTFHVEWPRIVFL